MVVEINIVEKNEILSQLARFYIKRGILYIIIVNISDEDDYNGYSVTYSFYRRGRKASKITEGVVYYEFVKNVNNFIPEKQPLGSLNLIISDFFSIKFLKELGFINPRDPQINIGFFFLTLKKYILYE